VSATNKILIRKTVNQESRKTGKVGQDSKVDLEFNLLDRCAEAAASNHRSRTPEQRKQLNKIPTFLLSLFDPAGFLVSGLEKDRQEVGFLESSALKRRRTI
jgi:hypothetical protein